MKTIFVKQQDIERKWFLIDARDAVLGKVATRVAYLLCGKHKPEYTPAMEVGDYVVVVNAGKVRVTGRKPDQKLYYSHSGHPGGLRTFTFQKMIGRKPTYPVEHAIRGMLPRNRLGRKLFRNVKIYAGESHPHAAQRPEPLSLE